MAQEKCIFLPGMGSNGVGLLYQTLIRWFDIEIARYDWHTGLCKKREFFPEERDSGMLATSVSLKIKSCTSSVPFVASSFGSWILLELLLRNSLDVSKIKTLTFVAPFISVQHISKRYPSWLVWMFCHVLPYPIKWNYWLTPRDVRCLFKYDWADRTDDFNLVFEKLKGIPVNLVIAQKDIYGFPDNFLPELKEKYPNVFVRMVNSGHKMQVKSDDLLTLITRESAVTQ